MCAPTPPQCSGTDQEIIQIDYYWYEVSSPRNDWRTVYVNQEEKPTFESQGWGWNNWNGQPFFVLFQDTAGILPLYRLQSGSDHRLYILRLVISFGKIENIQGVDSESGFHADKILGYAWDSPGDGKKVIEEYIDKYNAYRYNFPGIWSEQLCKIV